MYQKRSKIKLKISYHPTEHDYGSVSTSGHHVFDAMTIYANNWTS